MKAMAIFQKSGQKGEFPLIPEASSIEVARYVAQSARSPAKKPAAKTGIFSPRKVLKIKNPVQEPTTPMEKILAPQVVNPPWARNRA